jgi:hypothetical protein
LTTGCSLAGTHSIIYFEMYPRSMSRLSEVHDLSSHAFTTAKFLAAAPKQTHLLDLKSATSLLDWYDLLHTLGSLVGIVYLGPLGKSGRFQVATVVHIGSVLLDDLFSSSEVTSVDRDGSLGLGRLASSLGGGLLDQLGLIFFCAHHIVYFGVGNSGILELVQRFDVSLFCAEFNGTRSLGVAISLHEKGVAALGDLPHQRIWTRNHGDII